MFKGYTKNHQIAMFGVIAILALFDSSNYHVIPATP